MRIHQLLALLTLTFTIVSSKAQYCEPQHGAQWFAPIIKSVELDSISNLNTTIPLTVTGYSDFTSMQTTLAAGNTYDITVTGGDFFPHNYAAWIDYNHDFEFSDDERIGLQTMGSAVGTWTFTVPVNAMNGSTRLRVRAIAEPFGPWLKSHHPCVPAGEGEAEDYTVVISGGENTDGATTKILSPLNATVLGIETVSVRLMNRGSSPITGATAELILNGSTVVVDTLAGPIAPWAYVDHNFTQTVDLTVLNCNDLEVHLAVSGDGISGNDVITKQVCKLDPIIDSKVYYIHSNLFFPMEPIGGGSTNQTTMDSVFGAGNWQLEYFETMDVNQVFSDSSCVIFIDGSYSDIDPLEIFLDTHGQIIEDWVAAGGHLFLNSSPTSGNTSGNFVMDWGFDGVQLVQGYDIGFAIPNGTHPIHSGPFTPAGTGWSAFNYSEGVLYGPGLDPIIIDDDDAHFWGPELNLPLVAEKDWGIGTIIFGVIGASQYFTDSTEAMNSRFNILDYLNECDGLVVGTPENESFEVINVYPNPSHGKVNIDLGDLKGVSIQVFNVMGQVVYAENDIHAPVYTFQLEETTGIYFVEINGRVQQKTVKFLLE